MGYNILSKVIELTDSNEKLAERLKGVALELNAHLPFDDSSIYLWNHKEKTFTLSAAAGSSTERKHFYSKGEGLPAEVRKKRRTIDRESTDLDPMKISALEKTELDNFRYAKLYPLISNDLFYGVLYLKAIKKPRLSPRREEMLTVIAKQLSASIQCETNYTRLKRMHREREKLRERLVHAEKIMALGELSATLAHEIRTPLVNIGGFTARLKKELGENTCAKYVDRMSTEVTRLENIINNILSVADEHKLDLKAHSLDSLTAEPIEIFKDSCASHNITVRTEQLTDPAPLVMADIDQIKIAFDNIIANAIQSMDKGGQLTVSSQREGEFAVITISDSGGGIPPELMGDIFNPFFTTKERGTGLGLTITHKIITRHGGWITAKNNDTCGVSFTVGLRSINNHSAITK